MEQKTLLDERRSNFWKEKIVKRRQKEKIDTNSPNEKSKQLFSQFSQFAESARHEIPIFDGIATKAKLYPLPMPAKLSFFNM